MGFGCFVVFGFELPWGRLVRVLPLLGLMLKLGLSLILLIIFLSLIGELLFFKIITINQCNFLHFCILKITLI